MSGKRARMAFAFAAVAIPLTEATDFPDPITTISIKNAFSVQRSCTKAVPVAVFMAEIAVICANTVGNFPEPAIRNNAETLAFILRLPHVKQELIIVRSVPNHPSATVITVRNAKKDTKRVTTTVFVIKKAKEQHLPWTRVALMVCPLVRHPVAQRSVALPMAEAPALLVIRNGDKASTGICATAVVPEPKRG